MNQNPLGTVALLGAIVTTALVAGLLVVFAHAVMPGLATLDDRAFLTAFQRIDAAIENPWLALTFLGSPVLALLALLLHVRAHSPAVPWLALALGLIVATVAITAAVHLPINATIQAAAPQFTDAAVLRADLTSRWVVWNVVRALTSTSAVAVLAWALFVSGRTAG